MNGSVQAPHRCTIDTPLGPVTLEGDGAAVCRISFGAECPGETAPYLERAAAELLEYLTGRRRAFTFPTAPRGTPFQRRVWEALCRIPYGQTMTYGALAASLGMPGAARAVGSAAGKNSCPMVIPCHRLVAAKGLGGFSAGLERKRALLSLENALRESL